jgi:dihydroflavonol-4-reductase
MRLAVTGATGLVGNNLLRQINPTRCQVRALVRGSRPRRELEGLAVDVVPGDITDRAALEALVDGVDAIVHAAALIHIGWTRVDESRRINVQGTRELGELCLARGIRMIHVSSVDTLAAGQRDRPATESDRLPSKPLCAYVASKRESEAEIDALVARGLDAVIVHPGFMLGPWDWKPSSGQMMLALARHRAPLAPGGGASVVDVRDVVHGILSAIEVGRRGERYILAGTNMPYLDLWKAMCTTMSRPGPLGRMTDAVAAAVGAAGDAWTRLRGREPPINSAITKMGQLTHYYSSDKARAELGYRTGDVENAIRDAWRWFADQDRSHEN